MGPVKLIPTNLAEPDYVDLTANFKVVFP
jgi:hypothetical protein